MRYRLAAGLGIAASSTAALAQSPYAAVNDSGDTAWLLTCSALILFAAIPGFAFYYGGQVKRRIFHSLLTQIAIIAAVVSLLWVAIGYTLAFGFVSNGWIGAGNAAMLKELGSLRAATRIPESTFVLFELGFALLGPIIMLGAWAGRARLSWAICFTAIWSLLIYAPVAHWVWGGGWMASLGVIDFAGGSVVHLTAGISAIVIALLMGKGIAFRESGVTPPPRSPATTLAGAGLIWLGWFGMVGGSALAATDDASSAIINMHMASCTAALTWIAMERIFLGKISLSGFASGLLSGLITISSAALFVSPLAAMLIGPAGALCCYSFARLLKAKFQIDDTLNIFALHGVGGAVGMICAGIFTSSQMGGTGLPEDVSVWTAFGVQLLCVTVIALYGAVVSALASLAVSLFLPMRVSEKEERDADLTAE
ncbi:ammonium transporter [Altererythrobacter indicus]|uniref:Ammonium transporter n=1 Tax=Altericroceibacterium indicum TaxID=374177 RepID=A0A845A6Z0_9SPHN|nr:ammonium transporter [Altericroceibacterium indicum]MXP25317.1 ammonium transporter [Altericroceibacterium indicum]